MGTGVLLVYPPGLETIRPSSPAPHRRDRRSRLRAVAHNLEAGLAKLKLIARDCGARRR